MKTYQIALPDEVAAFVDWMIAERKFDDLDHLFLYAVTMVEDEVRPVCKDHLENGEEIHQHHLKPKDEGGKDDLEYYVLVHMYCHQAEHANMRREKGSKSIA
jgi:hypothetical protein